MRGARPDCGLSHTGDSVRGPERRPRQRSGFGEGARRCPLRRDKVRCACARLPERPLKSQGRSPNCCHRDWLASQWAHLGVERTVADGLSDEPGQDNIHAQDRVVNSTPRRRCGEIMEHRLESQ
jgi:hypothetical protein